MTAPTSDEVPCLLNQIGDNNDLELHNAKVLALSNHLPEAYPAQTAEKKSEGRDNSVPGHWAGRYIWYFAMFNLYKNN